MSSMPVWQVARSEHLALGRRLYCIKLHGYHRFILRQAKVYDEQHLVPPSVVFPFPFLISSLSPRSVCSCIRSSVADQPNISSIIMLQHTVVALCVLCLSLNDILP
jgi:hypothetical protein